jgi:CubicO group peptidase (beta-lactamase class C family)
MRHVVHGLKILSLVLLVVIVGGTVWLVARPPELLRVGSGYAAKIVCSNVFIAGRDADDVLATDVQAPGNPLLRLMRVSVDHQRSRVHAALLGFIASNDAVYRGDLGCAVTSRPDDGEATRRPQAKPIAQASGPWPDGEEFESSQPVAALLSDNALVGDGMRAVVVVRNGRIVAEAYAPGFSKDMPLLGWSMTKTVNAAILGRVMEDGRLALGDRDLLPQWHGDGRRDITVANLLSMESGLAFDEDYGTVADVTRMLYLEDDMAGFAASAPLESPPGSRFHYSSGTAVLLSRIWMNALKDPEEAQSYPRRALFAPLGMQSAVLEADDQGTFAGSSYLYATARDWARFALLLVRDGVWQGNRLLPEGFTQLMQIPNGHSGARYSQAQTWLPSPDNRLLPPGTFLIQGHDGQTIAINPALDLVVVRLGLTPSWNRYDISPLVAAVVKVAGTEK